MHVHPVLNLLAVIVIGTGPLPSADAQETALHILNPTWELGTIPLGALIGLGLVVAIVVVLIANRRMKTEIEQRRALETALVDNEERLRTILHSAPEGVITVDHTGRITYWNPAAEKIFGYAEAEAIGRNAHRLLAPPASQAEADAAMETFATHGSGPVLNRVIPIDAVHKSGHEVPIDIARAPFRQDGQWHAVAFVHDATERRKAESELREAKAMAEASRRRLLDMSDALPCAVYQIRVEPDGSRRYAFVSKKVLEVLGVDLDTLRANEEARWRHVHEDDIEALRATIERVAREGERLFCEYRVRLAGGIRWIRQEALRHTQADGSVVWNGYWLDVTEIKDAEATLSDQLVFQRLLVDSLPNAVFFKGPDARFLGCNRSCERMFGIAREALVGRSIAELDLFPAKARERYHAADLALIREQASRHLQTRMRFADGLEHEVLYWATAFALSDGRPGGMIGVIVDISDRKRAEELVKETERWYRGILETAPDGMLVTNGEGQIMLANAQIERLFGYSREELLGQPVEVLVPPALRDRHREHRRAYLREAATRPMGEGLELEGLRKDGSEFPIEVGLSPLPGKAGEASAVSASIRDISERKRAADALREAKEKAEEATRAKSMFLANMSHEIRTPMNAIIGMAHLALSTPLTPRQHDYVTKIHGGALRLMSIINDILDFSKIEAGRLEMERVGFSLDDVLANVSMMVEQRATDKGLEVLIHSPVDVPPILIGDPLRLGQILTNLVNNAVKFTEHGEIEVATSVVERDERQVRLHFTVRDTGVGMSEAQVANLFRPFTQADGSTTRRYGGTGLGLSICKRLVELMGGEIWAESRAGEGSCFHFTVRLDVGVERTEPRRRLPAALDNLRVLVVDDHPAARQILVEGLAGLPLRADTVGSAREALAMVRDADADDPYRLVFMDWKMPEIDGAEATRLIKEDASLRHPPVVIVVTAFTHDEARIRAEEAGADGFLVKPIGRSTLVDILVEAVLPAPRLPPAAAPQPAAGELAGMHVLLVEDNEINRQIAFEVLNAAGAQVDSVANGKLALEALVDSACEPPYDCVLMDLQMPVMNGIEATQAIRRNPRLAHIPVIAMTAHALVEERERCLAAGMNDHLAKPIDPDQLIATLQRWRQTRPGGKGDEAATLARLRTVAGLDVTDGLHRLGGTGDLYVALLRQFARDYGETPWKIEAALAAGDRSLAAQLVHTVKGVAGNVGARQVHRVAGALETALRDGDEASVRRELDNLSADTRELVEALGKYLHSPEQEPATAVTPPHRSATEPAVQQLADLLARFDGEAVEFFDTSRERLRGALDAAAFTRLERALRAYRFDEALASLKSAQHRAAH